MTALSLLLYLWVVGPLAFFMSHFAAHHEQDPDSEEIASSTMMRLWNEHPVFALGLLLLFFCHGTQALISMLDPRWSLFWGFTPEASWRGRSPPPDLPLLTRSYTGSRPIGTSGAFRISPNARISHGWLCCRHTQTKTTWFDVSSSAIVWTLFGETVGYVTVIASGFDNGLLWGSVEIVGRGTTCMFLLSSIFPLLLTVLSAWDAAAAVWRHTSEGVETETAAAQEDDTEREGIAQP